ncbi:hypothetical protein GOV13_00480 [Candidatus Pacearchaeota archaeon]|nr:hypothetical protein [Candidatus Pacearchaeota archaeon]
MAKFSKDQWIGLILIIAAILIWVPLGPLRFLGQLGPIAVVLIGIYQLFR